MPTWKTIVQAKDEFEEYSMQDRELDSGLAAESVKILRSAIKTEDDLFLYCAALNYLNVFNKKYPNEMVKILEKELNGKIVKNGYYFKNFVDKALMSIVANEDFTLSSFCTFNSGRSVIIDIARVQFVFHNVKISKETKELIDKEIDKRSKRMISKYMSERLEKFRLQPIAESVLDYAKQLENLTIFVNDRYAIENE
jgi:hypothetical protein